MSQTYEQLVSGTTPWSQVYGKVNNMSEALRSAFSGTSFPTSPSPVAGQPCYRTDRLDSRGYPKQYVYTNNPVLGESGWIEVSEGGVLGGEVINARGTKPTLDQRLDVALNEDGTLKAATTLNPSQWYKPSLTFNYISTTSFTVNGDQTDIYKFTRRLKINLTGSTVYSEVVSATYSSPNTTVVIANAVLDNTLVDVEHSLFLPHKDSGALTKRMTDKVVALTDGATINTDASAGNVFKVTLAGNRTLAAPTNPSAGQECVWVFTQDGTGNRTITLNAVFRNLTGLSSITLSTAAGAVDYMTAVYNLEDTKWDVIGFVPLNISVNDSIINKTTDYTLVAADLTGRKTFTNSGGGASLVSFTFPPAVAGYKVNFEVVDSGGLRIAPNGTEIIRVNNVSMGAGNSITYLTQGLRIDAIYVVTAGWIVKASGVKRHTTVYHSGNQTLVAGGQRIVVWNTDLSDVEDMHNPSINNSRITIKSGMTKVRVVAVLITDGAANALIPTVLKTGNSIINAPISSVSTSGVFRCYNLSSSIIDVVTGDFLEIAVDVQTTNTILYQAYTPLYSVLYSSFSVEILE